MKPNTRDYSKKHPRFRAGFQAGGAVTPPSIIPPSTALPRIDLPSTAVRSAPPNTSLPSLALRPPKWRMR